MYEACRINSEAAIKESVEGSNWENGVDSIYNLQYQKKIKVVPVIIYNTCRRQGFNICTILKKNKCLPRILFQLINTFWKDRGKRKLSNVLMTILRVFISKKSCEDILIMFQIGILSCSWKFLGEISLSFILLKVSY